VIHNADARNKDYSANKRRRFIENQTTTYFDIVQEIKKKKIIKTTNRTKYDYYHNIYDYLVRVAIIQRSTRLSRLQANQLIRIFQQVVSCKT